MTPPAKTFMGSKINCFQGSITLAAGGQSHVAFPSELCVLRRGYGNVCPQLIAMKKVISVRTQKTTVGKLGKDFPTVVISQ